MYIHKYILRIGRIIHIEPKEANQAAITPPSRIGLAQEAEIASPAGPHAPKAFSFSQSLFLLLLPISSLHLPPAEARVCQFGVLPIPRILVSLLHKGS
jgi:hypothetical protein